MTDADRHRAFVRERWPEIEVDAFVPVEGGWECFTYLVADEWIFQFPRLPTAADRLRKQIALLPELAREVSSAVPIPAYASTDPVCMGYRRIAGRPMAAHVDGIWPERLGRFLYDLHLTPPEFVGMRQLPAAAVRDGLRAEVASLGEHVLPLLDPQERMFAEGTIERYFAGDDERAVRAVSHPRRHRPGARADHGGG